MIKSNFIKSLLVLAFSLFCFSNSASAADLFLQKASNTWTNEVELVFSNEIDEISLEDSEFDIRATSDYYDFYEVVAKELDKEDKHIVKLVVDRDFSIWEEYKVIVYAIQDVDWQIIVDGVDSEAFFTAEEIDTTIEPLVVEPTNPEPTWNGPVVVVDEPNPNPNLWWVILNAWDVQNQVDAIPPSTDVKTWPELFVILLLALILAWWIAAYSYKKV